ncbi:MAG: fasciclin domain-containing protein [Mariniphaga sp.]|nr:fasciclin domain-containing protein [Mariniphaga sp.]
MAKLKQLTLLIIFAVLFIGCEKDFDKFSRPEWLAGKVYTQIKGIPELETFTKCLELTGYDTIIDVSGSYTLFAPSNEAFQKYFQENTKYNSVEDIPIPELTKIVKYHIVQNPWSKVQLRSLDVYGWIDTLALTNNEPKGFKRETLLLNKDIKVGVEETNRMNEEFKIVDTLSTNWDRRIITDSRKFAPIFYKEYFDIYDLNSSDYEFYFGRPFEGVNEIYYANAKIVGDEIFAKNGFIYNIDRVVEPLKNGYEILSSNENSESYTDFLDLINIFPRFVYNNDATLDQAGADLGLQVDSLFDLSYPDLLFSVHNERTRQPAGTFGLPPEVTIRYHYGLMAPTNEALNEFVTEYLEGPQQWGRFENAPRRLKRIIANTYMSVNPIYRTDFENGFYNGELDFITVDQANIVDKKYGSSSSFFGLNKAIIPRAFSSVTGPIYRRLGYSYVMNAIEQSGLTSALKRQGQNYSLYVENDNELRKDSSLLYYPVNDIFGVFQISPGGTYQSFQANVTELRTLILNQVGVEQPNGIAKKEFIKNMAGNYIIIDNETGIVSGTAVSSDGYNGSALVDIIPRQISTDADNGVTYDVEDWFSYTATDMYARISSSYPAFHQLMITAGLALPQEYRYSFVSQNEFYTVFVPSQEAIDNFDHSGMTTEELRNALLLHFVQGKMIFTDGNVPSGYFETARIDEKSTSFSTVFTQLYIDTDYDIINVPAKDGSNYLTINEGSTNNIIIARSIGTGQPVFPVLSTNAVIHRVDRVLLVEELDTK